MKVISELEVATTLRSLDKGEVLKLVTSLENALIERSQNQDVWRQPQRINITTEAGGTTLVMPTTHVTDNTTTVKVVNLSPQGTNGTIVIMGPGGVLQGVVSAAEITAFRTALCSMILYRRFSPCSTQGHKIAVFGSGRQAEWHIRLARILAPVDKVWVFNRTRPRLETLAASLKGNIELVAGTDPDYSSKLTEVLQDADVIFGCTPSREPLFKHADLGSASKKRFISLIGSYAPHMHEVTRETLCSEPLYVDNREGCLEESGEIIDAGLGPHQMKELGEVLRETGFSIAEGAVLKCVGMGLMDLLLATQLISLAQGTEVEF